MRRITILFAVITFMTLNLRSVTGQAQWSLGQGIDGGDYRALMKVGNDIYAGSQYGGVYLSTNNGDSWTPKINGLPASVSVTRLMANGSSIFAGTSYWSKMGLGVYRSDDNGETWLQKNNGIEINPAPSFTDLYITGFAKTSNYLFTSTYHNGVFRSANNGENWVKVFDAFGPDSVGTGVDSTVFREIFTMCSVGDVIFAGGSSGTLSQQGIHRSFDQGLTWDIVTTGLPAGFVFYQMISSGSDLYVRGSHGFFWSPNNGDFFIGINNGISKPEGAGTGAISVEGSVVFASTYESSEGPKTYKSVNRGSTWTNIPAMSSYYVMALINNGNDIFATNLGNNGITSNGGGVVRSLDGGTTWASASIGLSGLNCRAFTANGADVFAGTYYYSGIYKSGNNGSTWSKTYLPGVTPNYQVLSMTTLGSIIFTGVNNTNFVYKSADNGVTWTTTATTSKPVWALGANATYLFAGTSTDGMRRSTNNGTSWTTINSGLPTVGEKSIRAITVSGSKIYVGNSRGVFVSSNDGTTWTAINGGVGNPGYTSIKTIAVKGDTLFAGTGSIILRSIDHGATWAFLPSASGLGASVILSGSTLYAGGTSGVYTSADWGETWNSLNLGFSMIPEINSLYIVNDILYAGTYGQSVWMYPLAQAPVAFAVTGGGNYCEGSGGLPVGLANSTTGVIYILYKDNVAQVPTVPGTGSAITFGNQPAGTYTVAGTNSSGTTPMTGSAVITENPAVAVSVSISADINPVPEGSAVTLTAVPVNGGATPAYQWKVNGTNAGTDYAVFTYTPANNDTVACTLTSSETCTTGNPATSNTVMVRVIPATISLLNIIVANGETNCYNALQTIYVAGNGNTFTVQAGGSTTMIAGQNIIFYPGTTVLEDGYLHGYISTEFCTNPSSPVAGNPVQSDVVQTVPQMVVNSRVRIYPNPAGNQFVLELMGNETTGLQKLEIYSLTGMKVVEQDCSGSWKQTVSVVDLAPGIYVVKVMTGGEPMTLKLIKM